jgi:hypothetical protein
MLGGGAAAAVTPPASRTVSVTMVDVGIVWVDVQSRLVDVAMGVGLVGNVVRRVDVPVMLVVSMPVGVIERGVSVLVLVTLGQVEPGAGGHERARRDQSPAEGLAEKGDVAPERSRHRCVPCRGGAAPRRRAPG